MIREGTSHNYRLTMMKHDEENEVDPSAAEEQMIPSVDSATPAKKRIGKKVGRRTDPTKRGMKRTKKQENATAKVIKYAALFLLVAQMVGLVLLMHYSRTNQAEDQPLYLASTAVFIMEVMKLVICCLVIAYQSGGNLINELNTHVIHAPMEILKLSVPSFLYCVQNNLLYLALTNLDAATYQVCYQLKILTTAVFSAILLQVRTTNYNSFKFHTWLIWLLLVFPFI